MMTEWWHFYSPCVTGAVVMEIRMLNVTTFDFLGILVVPPGDNLFELNSMSVPRPSRYEGANAIAHATITYNRAISP